jgi:hypothetical protein
VTIDCDLRYETFGWFIACTLINPDAMALEWLDSRDEVDGYYCRLKLAQEPGLKIMLGHLRGPVEGKYEWRTFQDDGFCGTSSEAALAAESFDGNLTISLNSTFHINACHPCTFHQL